MWMLGIPFEEMEQYVKDKNLSVEPDDSESSDNDEYFFISRQFVNT
jgi:tRNA(Ile)-lysidine synthase TilS/MesJ